VITIAAKDRDSGLFGTRGIRYDLAGTGSHLFDVDPTSGKITVAACREAEEMQCIDFERTRAYFLSFSATDENGAGRRSVVNLRVTIGDANDNPPAFNKHHLVASIDEGQKHFQPPLILR